MTERLHFHFSLSCTGEGNGNPLQCSCLENPKDGEPGGLPFMGSHRVGHDWSDLAYSPFGSGFCNNSSAVSTSGHFQMHHTYLQYLHFKQSTPKIINNWIFYWSCLHYSGFYLMYNMPYSRLLDDTDSQFPDFLHRTSFLNINEKKKVKCLKLKAIWLLIFYFYFK